ncbi:MULTISPECIES: NUDIX hydrolase [unclassified Microbacterium]|uniref:NUDIX hydrolase n=1 Tax=unclassified Microbacterium TaxID=2609290 RepID=UPI00300F97D9
MRADAPSEILPIAGTAVILRMTDRGPAVLLLRRPDRGSFAGGWVFPGGRVEESDRRGGGTERDHAARAAVRETAEEVGLRLGAVSPISCWTPPIQARPRIRTWFFQAEDPGGAIVASPDEVAETAWLTPHDALAAHAGGSLRLFPPTWVTLHRLRGTEAVDGHHSAPPLRFSTRVLDGSVLVWEGDDAHDLAPAPGGRHRLEMATLPWRYIGP